MCLNIINMHSSSLWLGFNTRLSKSDHISWFRWSFNQNVSVWVCMWVYVSVYIALGLIWPHEKVINHMMLQSWAFHVRVNMFKNVSFKVLKSFDTTKVLYFCQRLSSSYDENGWGGPMEETRPRLEIIAHWLLIKISVWHWTSTRILLCPKLLLINF